MNGQHTKQLELLRRAIREGQASGDPIPWDPEAVKREGRVLLAARKQTDRKA